MIICNKCLFVHISRTGGTSVREVMSRDLPCWIVGQTGKAITRRNLVDPHTVPNGKLQQVLGDSLEELWKFTIIRNPWDRFVSWFIRQKGGQSFAKFMDHVFDEGSEISLQSNYFEIPDWFDYVLRLENLELDWSVVQSRVGLAKTSKPLHLNKSRLHHHYSVYYRGLTSLRDRVREHEARLLELFPYEFEDVEEQKVSNSKHSSQAV